jgi:hypothetical protein
MWCSLDSRSSGPEVGEVAPLVVYASEDELMWKLNDAVPFSIKNASGKSIMIVCIF